MNRLRLAVLVTSVLALGLGGLGILVFFDPALLGISASCSGCIIPVWWFYAFLIAGAGGLAALAALLLAVIDALRCGRKLAAGLIALLFVVNIGGSVYLSAAVAATSGPGGRSAGAPSPAVMLIVAAASAVASPPVAALLYGLLYDRNAPLLAALSGQVALLVIAPLVVAPPWVVFNPANGAPVLSASAPHATVDCAQGSYPPITLKNTGAGTLRWTAFAAFDAVSILPSSGSLGPGAAETVTLSGAYTPPAGRPQEVGVEFDSNGGSERVTYACQGVAGATPTPPGGSTGGISVAPPGVTAMCRQGTYPPITVTNTSQSDQQWSAATKEPGITVSPQSGSLHPGQSQSVLLSGTTSSPSFSVFFDGGQQSVTVACK